MKAILLLLFTVFFLAFYHNGLAQAPTEGIKQEQPPTEETPVEESEKEEPPVDEAPAEEEKEEKQRKKKEKKEKSVVEDPAQENTSPPDEPKQEKKRGRKKKKDDAPAEETPSENNAVEDVPEETVPQETAPTPYKDDKKKDTWFRVFKMQRCPITSCETKMVHLHNGKKYRGRKKLKFIQNPKTGELQRVPVTDPGKRKKSTKLKKDHEYQKDFKLPDKPIQPIGK
ncbi:MAG: hypothetical protein H7329_03120 [Opitutaceae bacterium]|nr:hypothetical protein [Cytophagales bacterium]